MSAGGPSNKSTVRMLFFDIEIAPIVGTTWATYDTNVIWKIQDWYILCFAYKWQGENRTHVVSQPQFKGYTPGSTDDSAIAEKLHSLFDEAHILVAHNGNKFDIKKVNARFLYHGLMPPSHYQRIDTLLVARRHFGFTSNKLDELGATLGVGRKEHSNKELWRLCMAGDPKAWRKMERYNKQDVVLLEAVYDKLMPYDTGHPNIAIITGKPDSCPSCGRQGTLTANGKRYNKTSVQQAWMCTACRSSCRSRLSERTVRPDYV